ATARLEYYESPAAPPVVETSSLKMDLYRRDFTINTLAVKLNPKNFGTLIDFFGGQKDIKEGVIRVLHNLSFVEDPSRVLRAIRFEQRFGFKIGKLTLSLIRNAVKIDCFRELSGKRLFMELKLILKEEDPRKGVERMARLDLLRFVSPHLEGSDKLLSLFDEIKKVVAWYQLLYLEEVFRPWKVYWYGLISGLDQDALDELGRRLGFTDPESRRLMDQRKSEELLLTRLFRFNGDNYHLYTLLAPYDTEMLLYVMAKAGNEKVKRLISRYFTRLRDTRVLLTGKDLIAMGYEPGPHFSRIFERLLEARLNNQVRTKAGEKRFVRRNFEPGPGAA
ncbi:MAG: CCA tRNA nucleotidyltransferase, partial [Deltaproteobacteria bacterium]|nr:CCA tRNA nucleotidyltransferase [Deltaproteobacteria bacterium]